MMQATGEILALTTVATNEQAENFCRGLVEARLAACATMLPGALSVYRWKSSEVLRDSEVVILIKTHRSKLDALTDYLRHSHPYECPELLTFPVEHISKAYQNWLQSELQLEGNT